MNVETSLPDLSPQVDIPEPDYMDDDDDDDDNEHDVANDDDLDLEDESPPGSPGYSSSISPSNVASSHSNGHLVEPKKLVNPCLESRERQQLHKELLLNQKLGIDVLHQKSELKKELQRRKEVQKKRELEEYHRNKRSSLEIKLEEQANKLKDHKVISAEQEKKPIPEEEKVDTSEFLKVHSKINRAKVDS